MLGLTMQAGVGVASADPPAALEPKKVRFADTWLTWIELCEAVGFENAVVQSQDMETRFEPSVPGRLGVLLYKVSG